MSIVAKKIMMGSGAVALPSDSEFNRTSFLSHFDGSNDGVNNVFIDGHDTSSPHTVTAAGNVTQGSFGPFARPDGEWGWYFDDVDDYLSIADNTDFDLNGESAFTIEAWLWPSSESGTAADKFTIVSKRSGSSGYILLMTGSNVLQFSGGGSSFLSASSLNVGAWYHVAVVKISTSSFKIYVNGVEEYTTSSNINPADVSTALTIGADEDPAREYNGYMSNVRIVKGTAVYTSAFTPPTAPLTAITNTKLLTCQSNRFVDNSASGHTITPYGNTAVTSFGPFLTSSVYSAGTNGASAYFDGTGDYLDADDGVTFGTGAFTIEFFVYLNKSADQKLFDARPDGVNTVYPVISVLSNDTLNYYANSSNRITSSETLSENAWHHVAVCRSGTSTKMFLDGTQVGSTYSDSTNYADSGRMRIGASKNATSLVEGYISDVRVVHSALYTSNFTPPTAPLTAVTNTNLLLNMADGQAIDSTAQDNIKLEAGAKLSTAQYKFGTSSILFNAEADNRASFKTKPFGTGDWTIEGFFRKVAEKGDNDAIWDTRGSGQSGTGYLTLIDETTSGQTRQMYYFGGSGGTHYLGSASALSLNTWYHIAASRSGTSLRFFLDGTQVGSTFSDSTNYINDYFSLGGLGANYSLARGWDGYVDEFRISYMARYTSNFTAPSEPFADKGQ